MKNDNAEVIWISSNVHVICEMGQVLKLWHPDFPQSINISLPWPTTPPFCKGTGQFRTGTGTVGLNGDTTVASSKTLTVATYTNVFWFQRIVAEVKLQREVVLEFLCELRMASFFVFFFKKLAFFASFSSWKKVGNLDVEAVQRPFNATKLQGAWEIPSARRRVEATQFDLGVPAESGRLIG